MEIDPTKLTIDTIDKSRIRDMVLAEHGKHCKSGDQCEVFIDWNGSVDNRGNLIVVNHDWRESDYWTLDLYCECQSCNKSGFTTIRIDDDFRKHTTGTPEPPTPNRVIKSL